MTLSAACPWLQHLSNHKPHAPPPALLSSLPRPRPLASHR